MTKFDTSATMLPPQPAVAAPLPWHSRRWVRGIAIGAGVAGLLLAVLSVVPVGALGNVVPGTAIIDKNPVALKPGRARGVDQRVTIASSSVFPPSGEILFTTVAIDDQVSVLEWLDAERDPHQQLVPHDAIFSTLTTDENRQRNLQMMQVSKETAVLVAFQHLGVDVIDESGINFAEVLPDGPSAGILQVGEVIVSIDGAPITDFQSLQDALDKRVPGDRVEMTLEDNDTLEQHTVTITLGEHPDDPTRAFIGIASVGVRAKQTELPFDVSIDSGAIGGPSAGLAFTLSILDLLTPGELTGGHKVAVTGTIALDESVGDVGGAEQKAVGARSAGAEVFIVPVHEVADAEKGAGDMPVIGVSTLSEALDVLAGMGGDTTGLTLAGS